MNVNLFQNKNRKQQKEGKLLSGRVTLFLGCRGATYSNKQGLLYPINGGYRPLPKTNLRCFKMETVFKRL